MSSPSPDCVTRSRNRRGSYRDSTYTVTSHADLASFLQSTAAILASPRRATNSYAPTDKPFDPAVHDQFTAHDPLAVAHAMFCSGTDQNDRWSEVDELRDGWHIRTRRFGVEAEGVLTRGLYVVE